MTSGYNFDLDKNLEIINAKFVKVELPEEILFGIGLLKFYHHIVRSCMVSPLKCLRRHESFNQAEKFDHAKINDRELNNWHFCTSQYFVWI